MSEKIKNSGGLVLPVVGITLFILLFTLGGSWVASRPYSEGHRDGYVQKFSHKGLFRKSWEGDLALAGSARQVTAVGNVWNFTVSDPKVIEQLNSTNASQLVRLYYNEYLWKFSGATNYRITNVEILKE